MRKEKQEGKQKATYSFSFQHAAFPPVIDLKTLHRHARLKMRPLLGIASSLNFNYRV